MSIFGRRCPNVRQLGALDISLEAAIAKLSTDDVDGQIILALESSQAVSLEVIADLRPKYPVTS